SDVVQDQILRRRPPGPHLFGPAGHERDHLPNDDRRWLATIEQIEEDIPGWHSEADRGRGDQVFAKSLRRIRKRRTVHVLVGERSGAQYDRERGLSAGSS